VYILNYTITTSLVQSWWEISGSTRTKEVEYYWFRQRLRTFTHFTDIDTRIRKFSSSWASVPITVAKNVGRMLHMKTRRLVRGKCPKQRTGLRFERFGIKMPNFEHECCSAYEYAKNGLEKCVYVCVYIYIYIYSKPYKLIHQSTPWMMDSVYAFKCKPFRITPHTTFGIQWWSSFWNILHY
jgi:hypothetical protein